MATNSTRLETTPPIARRSRFVADVMRPVYTALLGYDIAEQVTHERVTRLAGSLLVALHSAPVEHELLPRVVVPDFGGVIPHGIPLQLKRKGIRAHACDRGIFGIASAEVIVPHDDSPVSMGDFTVQGFIEEPGPDGQLRAVTHVLRAGDNATDSEIEPAFGDMSLRIAGAPVRMAEYDWRNLNSPGVVVAMLEAYVDRLPVS